MKPCFKLARVWIRAWLDKSTFLILSGSSFYSFLHIYAGYAGGDRSMQQKWSKDEVEMREKGGSARRSLVLVHSQQNKVQNLQASRQHRPLSEYLLSVSVGWLVLLARKILAFLISGFIIIILGQRKAAPPHTVQQKALELDQATELEDQFISLASHELKTPMTTISGNAQLMLRRLSRIQELSSEMAVLRTALERIEGQTRRLNAIVDDLLDLNAIRAGKVELRMRPCNLGEVCREVIEDQRLLTNRTIKLSIPQSAAMVHADTDRLNQVIVNLVMNALKYSPEESAVQVSVSQHGNRALISVSDAGSGIPGDQQALIFEPFYRSPEFCVSAKSGLGLGLAICKEVVERHGGHIWCESDVGQGSTFFVELPNLSQDSM